jgi:hypothetical protein
MNQPQAIESLPAIPQTNGGVQAMAEQARVNLPVAYQAAKQAVATCESTDECRTWADKHAALAAYAKMRDDRDLHNYALRIQLRAERRWGELDRELYPDRHRENLRPATPKGTKTADSKTPEFLQNSRNVADHNSSAGTRPLAPDGTTEYQRVTARRLAAIPEDTFERQVESPTPPTKTQLAAQGTVKRANLERRVPLSFREVQTIQQFTRFCEATDAMALARGIDPEDIQPLRDYIGTAETWLRALSDALAGDVA